MNPISIVVACASASAALLADCGSEPSEADVKAALLKQLETAVGKQAEEAQQTGDIYTK